MSTSRDAQETKPSRALVIGAGLIGTSIGMALARAGWSVRFADLDTARELAAQRAVAKVAGLEPAAEVRSETEVAFQPDFVAIAVDPESTGRVLLDAAHRYVNATVIDTASVMSLPAKEVEASENVPDNIVLSHPLGGRATSGPDDAAPDLFVGRVWVLSRLSTTANEHVVRAEEVVRLCDAVPLWVSPERHDEVLAVTSHLPQLVASGLAAAVADLGRSAVGLSGPALTDMTRIADSPIEMWNQIVIANREPIASGLGHLIESLSAMREALVSGNDESVNAATTALLLRGRAGRSLISRKHAGLETVGTADAASRMPWVWVETTLPDVPGRLAATLLTAAEQGINVEDVRFDHAPHAATGTVALAVAEGDAARLRPALSAAFAGTLEQQSPSTSPVQLVALDGPSASGKSTVARRLAAALGWAYLDTGATYRAITLACLRAECPIDDPEKVTGLAVELLGEGRLALDLDPLEPKVWLEGEDVSADIRGAAVTSAVSTISAHVPLRSALVAWQRRTAIQAGRCVLEGRDTGAVVVPEARLKVWLTARPDVRASRRAQEAGTDAGADLARRDLHDAGRAADPMKPAPDALVVDTSERGIDEIVAFLLARVRD